MDMTGARGGTTLLPTFSLSLSLSLSLSFLCKKRLERELGRVMGRKVEKQKISRSACEALSLSLFLLCLFLSLCLSLLSLSLSLSPCNPFQLILQQDSRERKGDALRCGEIELLFLSPIFCFDSCKNWLAQRKKRSRNELWNVERKILKEPAFFIESEKIFWPLNVT